jgi:hypothetical protein
MKPTSHVRAVTKRRPSTAALSPIWELIFISESLLGLFGSFAGFGLQFLGSITALVEAVADVKGVSQDS